MKHLFVWIHRADGTFRLVGELASTDPVAGGRFESEFEYSPEWLADPVAFALDPVSLPLQPGRRFRAEQLHPPLAVFDDALPDDWGRRLLAQALKLEGRSPSPPEMLACMQGRGTGALVMTQTRSIEPILPTLESASLSALLTAAAQFEAGTLGEGDAFRKLLEGSSRVGGARPKALVHDRHTEWLAKFPSIARDGPHDVIGLEATCLELARRAGLRSPDFHIQKVDRRRVLLVRRFDVTEQQGRIHMVSMRTLCRERPGVFATSYSELAKVLDKRSASPAADVAMLFRHMSFNAAIGNVDDHLKNFWMLATESGYRLAPAFDLVPDIFNHGEHTLAFQYGVTCPTGKELLAVALAWSVAQADEILNQITNTVNEFAATARRLGVKRSKAFERIADDVRRRVSRMSE